jgi:hypothetical protein
MMAVVPPDWRFLFIGTEESVAQVGRAYSTQYQQVIGKLDLMVLPEPWKIDTKELVWRTLTDPRFYDEFLPGVEWLLKYESDSIMCANSEKSLNDWLDWSWVGAPKYVCSVSTWKGKGERDKWLTCAGHGMIVSLALEVSPCAACPSFDRSWNSKPDTTIQIPKTNGSAPVSSSCPMPKSHPIWYMPSPSRTCTLRNRWDFIFEMAAVPCRSRSGLIRTGAGPYSITAQNSP